MTMDNDRRSHTRIHFAADARMIFTENVFLGELIDVSLKGGLFMPDELANFNIGQRCILEFRLGDESEFVRMKSAIANVRAQAVGLQCECMDLDSATHLRRLVELNLGDTLLLERELSKLKHH